MGRDLNLFLRRKTRLGVHICLFPFFSPHALQERFCQHLELEPGTAMNAALRENIFVAVVCVLNKLPVFSAINQQQVAQIEAALVLCAVGYYIGKSSKAMYAAVGGVGGYVLRMYV